MVDRYDMGAHTQHATDGTYEFHIHRAYINKSVVVPEIQDYPKPYCIAKNVGGGKLWRLSIDSPKFSHPSIVNTLKCNGKLTQFAKVLPSNYTSGVISPKFHPANILRYTVLDVL